MDTSGMTTQEALDFYFLERNAQWRYRLDQAEDVLIEHVTKLLQEAKRELRTTILRFDPTQFSKRRMQQQLEEIEIYLALLQNQVADTVAEATGVAGSISLDEQYDILSLEGKSPNVRSVRMKATEFQALFETNPLNGKTLGEWVQAAFGEGGEVIYDAIRTGKFLGEGYRKVVDQILTEADSITSREAITIARTYIQSASVSAQEAVYAANRDIVSRVKWSAILEPGYIQTGRGTCLRCSALDQQTWALDEPRPDCPLHLRCRCQMLPEVDWTSIGIPEMEIDETVRPYTIRPDENIDAGGKRAILEVGQHKGSYATWFARQSEDFKLNVLGPGRLELYKQGMDFNGFVNSRTGELYTLEELKNE